MTTDTTAAAQGQTTPAAHVEIASDGPSQIYAGESRGQATPVPYTLTPQAEAYLTAFPEASSDEPEAGL